jgi:hypothetical protein
MSAGTPSRSEAELSPDEHRVLEAAHAELRSAVEGYEEFLGKELKPGEHVPVASATAMREAQERVEAAEARLWEVRERYLGWSRPSWAPSATLVSDWFSDEDSVYDELGDDGRS